jgi:hypothetical protein
VGEENEKEKKKKKESNHRNSQPDFKGAVLLL